MDTYLSTRGPAGFLGGLKQRLMLAENEIMDAGSAYNIPLINALIFYCGIEARSRPISLSWRVTGSALVETYEQFLNTVL